MIFATNGGEPKTPDWYHNLLADPRVIVEVGVGDSVVQLTTEAAALEGDDRARAWERLVAQRPSWADSARDGQTIPAVVLRPVRFDADPDRNKAIAAQLIAVHNELRIQLGRVREQVDAYPSGAALPTATLGQHLFTHCLTFCAQLHAHHTGEDGAFGAFEVVFPALAPVIERLRREHRAVAAAIDELRSLLARPVNAAGFAAFRAELDRLTADVEEHFRYEEEQLIPALTGEAG